jgi:hypothetical protein
MDVGLRRRGANRIGTELGGVCVASRPRLRFHDVRPVDDKLDHS